jgi:hypothetical protein
MYNDSFLRFVGKKKARPMSPGSRAETEKRIDPNACQAEDETFPDHSAAPRQDKDYS